MAWVQGSLVLLGNAPSAALVPGLRPYHITMATTKLPYSFKNREPLLFSMGFIIELLTMLFTGSLLFSTNVDRPFPYLDTRNMTEEEKQELEDRLQEDTKCMLSKYACLVSSTNVSLQKQGVNPKDIAVLLLSLRLFDTYENQQRGLNDDGRTIQKASSIPDIFIVMHHYWSFFNCGPLEDIIKCSGTPEDKANLQMYLDDRKIFCRRRIFEVPPHVYGSDSNKGDWVKFTVKLDDKIQKLSEVEKLQSNISKILGLPYLYLRHITDGCVEVAFLIPQLVAQKVFPLSDDQQNALSANHVVSSSCNLVHPQQQNSEALYSKQEIPQSPQPIRQPSETVIGGPLSRSTAHVHLKYVPVLSLPRSSGQQ